jgi:sugar phosphate isomerase/epimerase
VYASTQPGYDPHAVLDQVFADMKYAGMDGVELMHQALRHADAVERIRALVERHGLPVTGTSYSARCGTARATARSSTTWTAS